MSNDFGFTLTFRKKIDRLAVISLNYKTDKWLKGPYSTYGEWTCLRLVEGIPIGEVEEQRVVAVVLGTAPIGRTTDTLK